MQARVRVLATKVVRPGCPVVRAAAMTAGSAAASAPAPDAPAKPTQAELVVQAAAARGASGVQLIDIGCNLVDKNFRFDRPDVLRRAKASNVAAIVVTGTCVSTSSNAAELCDHPELQGAMYPQLYFTAGVHPHNAKLCDAGTLQQLRKLAAHPRCVAIGECGLDFNRNFSPQHVQIEWFEQQVLLARELGKPLFLHCRDAGDMFAEVLARHASPSAAPDVVHCFTGSRSELQQLIDLGAYIGITGWICDDRPERGADELRAQLPLIPRQRLMIETDAPYLTPRTIKPSKARPWRNEPALLPYVLHTAAQALGTTPEELGLSTTEVACRVFGIKLP